MKDLNEVFIVGRAVDNIKSFNYNGRIKYSMVIAINYYSYRKKKAYSDFIPVSFWKDEQQENPNLDALSKGDTVIVNGRISIDSYEKDGNRNVSFEVVGNYIKYFKLNKDSNDLNELVEIIKTNSHLLEAVVNTTDVKISDKLIERLNAEKDD